MSAEGDIPTLPTPSPVGEGSDIDPIRTETIFSRMPLHVLSKSGPRPQINIEKRSADGKIEEKWEVSYNEKYGPAKQLAYDLHTLVIERAIEEAFDEARRLSQPFPRLIPVHSLNDIANRLGPNSETRNTNRIKKALSQNAGILITAFKRFRGNDGVEYTLEGVFTPYGIFFFGQKLPGGPRADQVYINLNDAYFDAWSKSASRPLDYNYKAQLPPIPRRFYELVSYAMYGAIKNNQSTARYRYSEFCKNAPQLRYDTFDQVKKQMYKIHRPHIQGQYILKVKYEQTVDEKGGMDWWMVYTPGPRAYAEFGVFSGKKLPRSTDTVIQKGAPESARQRWPRQANLKLVPEVNTEHLGELTKRGVSEIGARKLLAKLPPDHPILDLLEWTDQEIASQPNKIKNPAGFYIRVLEDNTTPPPTFVSSRKFAEQKAAEEAKELEVLRRQAEADAQAEADREQLDEEIARMNGADRLNLRIQAEGLLAHEKDYWYTHSKETGRKDILEETVSARMRKLLKARQAAEPSSEPIAIATEMARPAPELPSDDSIPLAVAIDAPESQISPNVATPQMAFNLETILTTLQLPSTCETTAAEPAVSQKQEPN